MKQANTEDGRGFGITIDCLGIITQMGKNADLSRISGSISPSIRRISSGMNDAV
jgi:hypothetical protein